MKHGGGCQRQNAIPRAIAEKAPSLLENNSH